jgi:adenylyl-sulfate kinase
LGKLGELLELLHEAHSRVSTFEVEYRDWHGGRHSNQVAIVEDDDGKPQLRWRGGRPWPEHTVTTRRVWLERPNHLRVEITEDEMLIRLGVRAGPSWWRWDAINGTTRGSILPGTTDLPQLPQLLLAPGAGIRQLMTLMRLEPTGTGERAGRLVVCARAWPRGQNGSVHHELEFDAEHGSILRRAAFQDGERIWEREAREVHYGTRIDPECFVFVAPDDRQPEPVQAPIRKGATVWLTGIPAAGKTTLAYALERELSRRGAAACVLDGDVLRRGLSSDLGLSPADRAEQARRVRHVAALVAKSGLVAIVALISPFAEDRRLAREAHAELNVPFLEVWVDTPLRVCEERDPKGLYAQARSGELHGLTGLDAPYESPVAPDLRIAGDTETPDAAARQIADHLRSELAGVPQLVPQR